jgi:hypothetical protein
MARGRILRRVAARGSRTRIRTTETIEPALDASNYIGEIDNLPGFHIRLAHGTVYRHFMQSFKFLGMTQKQVSVLWLVYANAISRRCSSTNLTVAANEANVKKCTP